ncbi:replication initiator [Streptomyces sp. NPDC051567]|uniref:replication initiator n=1 Tax=Streptomyces sp. NPDC051567 TaxID=3365660 RepID=UPI0037B0BDF9
MGPEREGSLVGRAASPYQGSPGAATKSRCYSVTLGALRAARRAWRTDQTRVHTGLPESDPTTTLVIGHWAYHGSGYSPGAALLAAAIWHRRELERQFEAEGGS